MLIDRSSFPTGGALSHEPEVTSSPPLYDDYWTVEPAECSTLFGDIDAAQAGGISWKADTGLTVAVTVMLTDERPDFSGLVSKCANVRFGNNAVVFKELSIEGLKEGATAFPVGHHHNHPGRKIEV